MAQANSFTVKTADEVRDMLDFLHAKLDCCLVIDGESLQVRGQCVHPKKMLMNTSAVSGQVQNRVCPTGDSASSRGGLSMQPNAEGGCRQADPRIHQEDCMLYR